VMLTGARRKLSTLCYDPILQNPLDLSVLYRHCTLTKSQNYSELGPQIKIPAITVLFGKLVVQRLLHQPSLNASTLGTLECKRNSSMPV
jgi:hypothetical protein